MLAKNYGFIIFYCFFLTFVQSYEGFTCNISTPYPSFLDLEGEPKISTNSRKISIEGNDEWLAFKNVGNCSGEGTFRDPYIIKDLIINPEPAEQCIRIENSDVYFIIENCTLTNLSGRGTGIVLREVINGHVINNTCSGNTYGISLNDINNCTFTGNNVSNNRDGIIIIPHSSNLTFSENTVDNNLGNGIEIEKYCNNFTFTGNTLNYNSYAGIRIGHDCSNFTLVGNVMNKCGLFLMYDTIKVLSSHNIDNTNLVNGKPLYFYTNKRNLEPINLTDAGQVILVDCSDSIISNLNVSYSSIGISLYYSKNINISGNIACNNSYGIFLYRSDRNEITGNIVNNNRETGIDLIYNVVYDNGLKVYYCKNNTLIGNTAKNNRRGMFVSGNDNLILGNTLNNNRYGLMLMEADNNIILNNTVSNNYYEGIRIRHCYNIQMSGNIVNKWGLQIEALRNKDLYSHNIDPTNLVNGKPLYFYANEENLRPSNFMNAGQVILAFCSDSIISDLNISYLHKGISLYYSKNITISRVTAKYNEYGIYLADSDKNIILENQVSNNTEYGIYLADSDKNIILENQGSNNTKYGICIRGNNNLIQKNRFNNNAVSGICIGEGSFNAILENIANNNHYDGIVLSLTNSNVISGNIAFYNQKGIFLYRSNRNEITGNTANYNYFGILLKYSDSNIIMGNNFLNNDICIEEEDCSGNIFRYNLCPDSLIFVVLSLISVGAIISISYILLNFIKKKQLLKGKYER